MASKFKITKRYSLASLGDEWKDCYLDFYPLTVRELDSELAELAEMDQTNTKDIMKGTKITVKILQDHFVNGCGIDKEGKNCEITKDDLLDMPADVLGGVISFLSGKPATTV